MIDYVISKKLLDGWTGGYCCYPTVDESDGIDTTFDSKNQDIISNVDEKKKI